MVSIQQMSACIPLNELSSDQKSRIKKELFVKEVLSKTAPVFAQPKVIRDFYVDGDTRRAYVPFAWAQNNLNWQPCGTPKDGVSFKGEFELRDYQKEPIGRTIDTLLEHGSTILSAYCGFGKTITSLYIASKIGGPVAILVKGLSIIAGWKKDMEKIGVQGDIEVISAHSLKNYTRRELARFHFVIVDEAHLMCAETFTDAMGRFAPKYLLGLTATPTRPDGMDIILDHHFNRSRMTIIKEKREVIVKAIWTGIIPEYKQNRSGGVDWGSVVNFLAEDSGYNQKIINELLAYPDRRFMVLCARKAQIKLLESLCTENNITVTTYYESMKAPKNPDARVLIGTTSKLGVGFDDTSRSAILLACDVANQENIEQFTGRVVHRTKDTPLIIDFVHNFNSLRRHWSTRKSFYENQGMDIDYIDFPAKNQPRARVSLMKKPIKKDIAKENDAPCK